MTLQPRIYDERNSTILLDDLLPVPSDRAASRIFLSTDIVEELLQIIYELNTFSLAKWQVYPHSVNLSTTVTASMEVLEGVKYSTGMTRFLDIGSLVSSVSPKQTLLPVGLTKISNRVAKSFSEIPEVSVIYQDISGNELTYWVFINNEKYDDQLMDKLIDIELEILDSYSQPSILFRYVPLVLCDDPHQVAGGTAQLIFQR